MQLQGKKGVGAVQFSGPIDCVVKTVRSHGISGLYKGLSAMVIGNSAKAGVRFVAYEQFLRLVSGPDGKAGSGGMMLAGLGAGMTEAVLIVTPTETIKWASAHGDRPMSVACKLTAVSFLPLHSAERSFRVYLATFVSPYRNFPRISTTES